MENVTKFDSKFEHCQLANSQFKNCDLRGVELTDCNITGMTINGVAVEGLLGRVLECIRSVSASIPVLSRSHITPHPSRIPAKYP